MDVLIDRRQHLVETTCLAMIDDGHQRDVSTVVAKEHVVIEVYRQAGDEGLIISAPCRPWTDPHGHQRFAAVMAWEQPRQEAVTKIVLEADGSAMAREEVGHG
jgi:hypothetical protein